MNANSFAKIGYNFAGWATSTSGSFVYTNGQSVKNLTATHAGTVILYAKWTPKTFIVDLDRQGGNGGTNSVTATYASAMPTGTTITAPTKTGYAFQGYYSQQKGGGVKSTAPSEIGNYAFSEWRIGYGTKTYSTGRTIIVNNDYKNGLYNGATLTYGALYREKTEPPCVAEGTDITLADGTKKSVENLTGDEQLLVWNLHTGMFDTAPILFIDSDPAGEYEVINLTFSDGTTVEVVYEHGFWDFDLNKYVFLRSDAAKYIGHRFNKQTKDENGNLSYTRVQLTDVVVQTEYTTTWSPVTYGHLCYYVNGMLSMPGATTGLINIFDVDPDTMKIDRAAFAADIVKYGLFTYEEFAALYPVPEIIFEAFGGQYLKIAMGKGLLTEEMLTSLIERYSEFFDTENADADNQEDDADN